MTHKEEALRWIRKQGDRHQGPGASDLEFRIALIHALLNIGDQLEKVRNSIQQQPR